MLKKIFPFSISKSRKKKVKEDIENFKKKIKKDDLKQQKNKDFSLPEAKNLPTNKKNYNGRLFKIKNEQNEGMTFSMSFSFDEAKSSYRNALSFSLCFLPYIENSKNKLIENEWRTKISNVQLTENKWKVCCRYPLIFMKQISKCCIQLNQYEEAEFWIKTAMKYYEKFPFSGKHFSLLFVNYSSIYFSQKKYKKAKEILIEANKKFNNPRIKEELKKIKNEMKNDTGIQNEWLDNFRSIITLKKENSDTLSWQFIYEEEQYCIVMLRQSPILDFFEKFSEATGKYLCIRFILKNHVIPLSIMCEEIFLMKKLQMFLNGKEYRFKYRK